MTLPSCEPLKLATSYVGGLSVAAPHCVLFLLKFFSGLPAILLDIANRNSTKANVELRLLACVAELCVNVKCKSAPPEDPRQHV